MRYHPFLYFRVEDAGLRADNYTSWVKVYEYGT